MRDVRVICQIFQGCLINQNVITMAFANFVSSDDLFALKFVNGISDIPFRHKASLCQFDVANNASSSDKSAARTYGIKVNQFEQSVHDRQVPLTATAVFNENARQLDRWVGVKTEGDTLLLGH